MRRRELFPADRGLQSRMVAVAVLTPLAVLAAVAALALVLPLTILGGIALAAAIGIGGAVQARRVHRPVRLLAREEAPELLAAVECMCVVADVPVPELALSEERQPNSWVIDLPGRPPRVHVTRGLLDALTPEEVEAVLAHELSHVVHRDATVMSVVGLPGAVLRDGARHLQWGWLPLMIGALLARLVGTLSQIGTNALSRYRETAADAAAARLTGRPAALASALRKVSGGLAAIPSEDLRAVAARNAFNLMPVEEEGGEWRALLGRTHPSVQQRIAALELMERRMHAARRSADRLLDA